MIFTGEVSKIVEESGIPRIYLKTGASLSVACPLGYKPDYSKKIQIGMKVKFVGACSGIDDKKIKSK